MNLNPPLFIKVPLLSKESERSCICVFRLLYNKAARSDICQGKHLTLHVENNCITAIFHIEGGANKFNPITF